MKPNVLIIIDTGIIGGPGKGLFQFLRHVNGEQLDYVLCNFQYKRPKSTEFVDQARSKKINLRLLSQRMRYDPSPIWQAYSLIKSEGCNIVQTHGYKGHAIAFILSRLLGIPWIAVAHGWTNEDWKVRLYHWLDIWLLRYADLVVAVSPVLYRTLAGVRGPRRTELVFNAVEEDEIAGDAGGQAVRTRLGLGPDDLLIGTFGRQSAEKGHKILLQAFRDVLRSHPHAKLLIVGDGPERGSIENLAADLLGEKRIIMLGHQSAIRDYYEAIDLLVLPSLSEGLPNVVLEAMCLGKPVIATDVGAIREVIDDGQTGWIVDSGNHAKLAGAISQALGARTTMAAVALRAKTSLYPKFSPAGRAERFLVLYNGLLQRKNRSRQVGGENK